MSGIHATPGPPGIPSWTTPAGDNQLLKTGPTGIQFSGITEDGTDIDVGTLNLGGTDGAWNIGDGGANRPGTIDTTGAVSVGGNLSLSSSSAAFLMGAGGSACAMIFGDRSLGVQNAATAWNIFTQSGASSIVLAAEVLADAADNVLLYAIWNHAQTGAPTNEATVRLLSCGTTNDANVYTEKLAGFADGDFECVDVRASGPIAVQGAQGEARDIDWLEELVTISTNAFTDTTIEIPANAQVESVDCFVETAIPGPTTEFDLGIEAIDLTRYAAALAVAQGTSNVGSLDGVRAYASGDTRTIRITHSAGGNPGAATGKVRIRIWFKRFTAPTS